MEGFKCKFLDTDSKFPIKEAWKSYDTELHNHEQRFKEEMYGLSQEV